MIVALYGTVNSTSCCGLNLIHGLSVGYLPWDSTLKEKLVPGRAYAATTVAHEKGQIKALKKLGFKAKLKWTNSNTGNVVTLWTYVPGRRKRKKT